MTQLTDRERVVLSQACIRSHRSDEARTVAIAIALAPAISRAVGGDAAHTAILRNGVLALPRSARCLIRRGSRFLELRRHERAVLAHVR